MNYYPRLLITAEEKFDVKLLPDTEASFTDWLIMEGLAHISLCLVNPEDVVLIPDPGYPIFSA